MATVLRSFAVADHPLVGRTVGGAVVEVLDDKSTRVLLELRAPDGSVHRTRLARAEGADVPEETAVGQTALAHAAAVMARAEHRATCPQAALEDSGAGPDLVRCPRCAALDDEVAIADAAAVLAAVGAKM